MNYVADIPQVFAGHAVCGSNGAWVNSITFAPLVSASFHPTNEGEAAYAQAFEDYMGNAQYRDVNGFPSNPAPIAAPSPADPAPTESWGELSVSGGGAQASTSCSDELQAGQQVEVVGDGFAPGTPVTVSVTSPGVAPASAGSQATVGTVDADSTGSIDTTVQLPFSATGYNEAPGDLAFLDATGTGASAPSNDDIAMVSLVAPTSPCALAFPAASASVQLSVDDPALLGAAGAVFEVSGPGLPGSVLGSPLADPPCRAASPS